MTDVTDLPDSNADENTNAARVSSPASTGGAGTSFEQHVGGYWLAQLLVRGIPPVLIDTVVTDVSFQTERLGWHTDDFLIACERSGAAPQKLAGQVKRISRLAPPMAIACRLSVISGKTSTAPTSQAKTID